MQHKPQALLQPGTPVKITKHRRRVGSEFATLIDVFWREDEPWIALQLPSGQRTAIPALWTDVPTAGLAAATAGPEILPAALLELTQYCQTLQPVCRQAPRNQGRRRNKK
jgi:hypothetical protein